MKNYIVKQETLIQRILKAIESNNNTISIAKAHGGVYRTTLRK